VENISEARESFQMLTDAAPQESVDIWRATIQEAEAARSESPKAMDIMHSKIKTRQSLKEITAAVMEEDVAAPNQSSDPIGITDWILEGLNIEDEQ
jgi:hypothetical protein